MSSFLWFSFSMKKRDEEFFCFISGLIYANVMSMISFFS